MIPKNSLFLCILALTIMVCKGNVIDVQRRERHCLYRCRGSLFDLEDMDKRLTLVTSEINDLITFKKSFESFTSDKRADISTLASKISNLEMGNEVLKVSIDKEKAMLLQLQNVTVNQQDSLNRVQASVVEMKENLENAKLKTEATESGVENLKIVLERLLRNETLLFERLNSLENSNPPFTDLSREGNIVKAVNNISTTIDILSEVQSEQKRYLSHLENQIKSCTSALTAVINSAENMSFQVAYLQQKVEDIKQKQFTFADILKKLTFEEVPKYYHHNKAFNLSQMNIVQRHPLENEYKSGRTSKNPKNTEIASDASSEFTRSKHKSKARTDFANNESQFRRVIENEGSPVASVPGLCELRKSRGPCGKSYKLWYYDSHFRKCREFMYGGCLGNQNRFRTKTACEEICRS